MIFFPWLSFLCITTLINTPMDQSNQDQMIANYGDWKSPISAEMTVRSSYPIINFIIDGQTAYWCEMRPDNHGYYTIVQRDPSGELHDITPKNFNVRTFVHEYGGGAFAVSQGTIFASNAFDHKIYRFKAGEPVALTEGSTEVNWAGKRQWQGTRFANLRIASFGIFAIGEEHKRGMQPDNFLALIDKETGKYRKLASGYDFYSSPAISPDEKKIAWISWNHPNMSWTQGQFWIADIDRNGNIENARQIAGFTPESILQPEWSEDGILYFISDRTGFWNLYRLSDQGVENICPMEAEVGGPEWTFGQSAYAFLGKKIIFAFNQMGVWDLAAIDPKTKEWEALGCKSSIIHHLRAGKDLSGNAFVQFFIDTPTAKDILAQIKDGTGNKIEILQEQGCPVDLSYISTAQHIEFPSNQRKAYGFYYPPKNPKYQAPVGEKPPLIVMIHGGPTAEATSSLSLSKQFWTSRGFAILDVNYGGSSGYGRPYRELLNGNLGVVDVEDCVNGALYLASLGLVDKKKLLIRGASSGGYTTLAALAFHNVFSAGASYFGIADITALAKDTHKFESRYIEMLVGKYPEEKELWTVRSPIHAADQIKCPLILFQGECDLIVPPNQSMMIYTALEKKGVPVELHLYHNEGHGFKIESNITHALEQEAEFYHKIFSKQVN